MDYTKFLIYLGFFILALVTIAVLRQRSADKRDEVGKDE